MVNHAAGTQGRDGLRLILDIINHDLGPVTADPAYTSSATTAISWRNNLTVHGEPIGVRQCRCSPTHRRSGRPGGVRRSFTSGESPTG